jgi:hypothetical protein
VGDDDDRTGSVVGDVVAHGPEQQPFEAAESARSDDHEAGLGGFVDDLGTGVAARDNALDRGRQATGAVASTAGSSASPATRSKEPRS